jgi:hypothetical protein
MGPQDPKDVARDTARDLSALVGKLAALKADAYHWLSGPEYATLTHHWRLCTRRQRLRWWKHADG